MHPSMQSTRGFWDDLISFPKPVYYMVSIPSVIMNAPMTVILARFPMCFPMELRSKLDNDHTRMR